MLIYDDGIELSADLEVPEEHDGHRLVILLHGFTSTKDRPHNIRAATAMRDAGFATLRFDLYGHGESGGEFRNHTLFKWISNTMAVINWALAQGYDDLYLSGHSQGGLVAALVAGMEPDRIHGLILRAPAFMIPQGARDGLLLGESFEPDHVPEEIDVMMNELHEYDIMERFAKEKNSAVLMKALRGRKPFRTFKDRAIDIGLDQAYYEFRSRAYVNIAREWCRENEIPFTE